MPTQKIKCPWCNLETNSPSMPKHLRVKHNKTALDYLLFQLNLEEKDVPICPYCKTKPVAGTLFEFKPTCDSPDCIAADHHHKRSVALSKRHQKQIAEGTHNLLKKNLKLDESGKSIAHIHAAQAALASGKSNFLAQNRPRDAEGNDLLAQKIAQIQKEKDTVFGGHDLRSVNAKLRNKIWTTENKHPWQQMNLMRDATGKSIQHVKAAQTQIAKGNFAGLGRWDDHILHKEELTKEVFINKFIKDNRFLADDCCSYFNLSISTVNLKKREFEIYTPNVSTQHVLQNQVLDYIQNNYSGTIRSGARDVIAHLELDIYLPEKNLAIEFDGLKFHASGINPFGEYVEFDPQYHLNKTVLCEEKGIQLLHIFDSEWLSHKSHIWKSVIKNKLGLSQRIYARKCQITKNISGIKTFLEDNHLQGYAISQYNYGLLFNNELVAVMTFGADRYNSKYNYELIRYCSKVGTTVVGGAAKLLHAFQQDHPGSIISYANRRWSQGNLYEKLGFKLLGATTPNYYYFHPQEYKLYNRIQFQKWKLKDKFSDYDENLSETENMYKHGYMKVYDCGNLKYVLE